MPGQPKSGWDIADILLRPLGGLLTALSVAGVGFFGSQYLGQKQAVETNIRLYAELMSNRERADSDLRKDMFNLSIKTFLQDEDVDVERQLLELELLAYNFHDAIDLAPLFKHVERKVKASEKDEKYNDWDKRLSTVALEVIGKQAAVLEDSGQIVNADLSLTKLKDNIVPLIDEEFPTDPTIKKGSQDDKGKYYRFTVEALDADVVNKSVLIRLKVEGQPSVSDGGEIEAAVKENEDIPGAQKEVLIDATFNVDFFDFPMIDNSRLPDGHRVAVVLRRFDQSSVRLSLLYFPGSRASLKDKPFYDEIIDDLHETRKEQELQVSQ